jgi:hypothetical protein
MPNVEAPYPGTTSLADSHVPGFRPPKHISNSTGKALYTLVTSTSLPPSHSPSSAVSMTVTSHPPSSPLPSPVFNLESQMDRTDRFIRHPDGQTDLVVHYSLLASDRISVLEAV